MVGDVWHTGNFVELGGCGNGDAPAFLCQLEADLGPSERLVVGSDEQWLARASGTWVNDLQSGERTDLRNEPADWTRPGADDSGWEPVMLRAAPGSRLVPSRDDGIRVVDVLAPQSIREA